MDDIERHPFGHPLSIPNDFQFYVTFNAGCADPEIIRRALTRMIGCYSVAWLFDDAGTLVRPAVAVIPIFDGDGFALMARSRTSIRMLLPDIPIPLLH
jgi:hypothetical protein